MRRDLEELWRFVLRRPIQADELAATEARLAAGMSYASLLQELATSAEYEHLRRLEDGVAWAAAQRRDGERVLDVGYAFAEAAYLEGLGELGDVTGVDLVAAEVPGVKGVQADLR